MVNEDESSTRGSAVGSLLDAHYRCVQGYASASADLQQRLQTLQFEYQAACARATRSQQPEDAQEAMEAWQRMMQVGGDDVDVTGRSREAYEAYVAAVGQILTAQDVDPATLLAISQSMATVATYAAQATAAAPGAKAA